MRAKRGEKGDTTHAFLDPVLWSERHEKKKKKRKKRDLPLSASVASALRKGRKKRNRVRAIDAEAQRRTLCCLYSHVRQEGRKKKEK